MERLTKKKAKSPGRTPGETTTASIRVLLLWSNPHRRRLLRLPVHRHTSAVAPFGVVRQILVFDDRPSRPRLAWDRIPASRTTTVPPNHLPFETPRFAASPFEAPPSWAFARTRFAILGVLPVNRSGGHLVIRRLRFEEWSSLPFAVPISLPFEDYPVISSRPFEEHLGISSRRSVARLEISSLRSEDHLVSRSRRSEEHQVISSPRSEDLRETSHLMEDLLVEISSVEITNLPFEGLLETSLRFVDRQVISNPRFEDHLVISLRSDLRETSHPMEDQLAEISSVGITNLPFEGLLEISLRFVDRISSLTEETHRFEEDPREINHPFEEDLRAIKDSFGLPPPMARIPIQVLAATSHRFVDLTIESRRFEEDLRPLNRPLPKGIEAMSRRLEKAFEEDHRPTSLLSEDHHHPVDRTSHPFEEDPTNHPFEEDLANHPFDHRTSLRFEDLRRISRPSIDRPAPPSLPFAEWNHPFDPSRAAFVRNRLAFDPMNLRSEPTLPNEADVDRLAVLVDNFREPTRVGGRTGRVLSHRRRRARQRSSLLLLYRRCL